MPAWLRFLNTEYVEVIFRGLLATKAVRSCLWCFSLAGDFVVDRGRGRRHRRRSRSEHIDLASCTSNDAPLLPPTWLHLSALRQKSRESLEAAPNASPSSASAGGGSEEHVREAEDMLHDVCQRWCTSWWKRGLFLRVRTRERNEEVAWGGEYFAIIAVFVMTWTMACRCTASATKIVRVGLHSLALAFRGFRPSSNNASRLGQMGGYVFVSRVHGSEPCQPSTVFHVCPTAD